MGRQSGWGAMVSFCFPPKIFLVAFLFSIIVKFELLSSPSTEVFK